MSGQAIKVSVVIPTLDREEVLCDTLSCLLEQTYPYYEILVVDQTEHHSDEVTGFLERHQERIRLIHLEVKSTPFAKNVGICNADGDVVLFCDDDVIAVKDLIARHVDNYSEPHIGGVAGRVFEPGELPLDTERVGRITPCGRVVTNHASNRRVYVQWAKGGNMSFRRELLLEAGLFDEAFSGNAIFEEPDLCFRVRNLGYKIVFDPTAEVRHLAYPTGGCQSRSLSQTDYYYHFIRNKTLFFLTNMKWYLVPCLWVTFLARAAVTGVLEDRSLTSFVRLALQAPLDGYAAFQGKQ